MADITDDIQALFRWLKIRDANDIPFPTHLRQLEIDAEHSTLLQRLLDGEKPLDEPPPLTFSSPWYSLIDEGEGVAFEAFEPPTGQGELVINQCSKWRILERFEDEEGWIVTYGSGKHVFKVFRSTVERTSIAGGNGPHKVDIAVWKLERLEDYEVENG